MNTDLDIAAQLLVTKKDVEELEAELSWLNAQRDEVGRQAKGVAARLDAARAKDAALVKISQMPDAEKAALLQALQPQGVPSGEEFGKV